VHAWRNAAPEHLLLPDGNDKITREEFFYTGG
jgi:hypothetical protein